MVVKDSSGQSQTNRNRGKEKEDIVKEKATYYLNDFDENKKILYHNFTLDIY